MAKNPAEKDNREQKLSDLLMDLNISLYLVTIFLKFLNLNLAILPEAHQERLNMRLAASKTIN